MSEPIISVDGLSKRYLVGHEGPQEAYQSLRETIVRQSRNFARNAIDMARGRQIIQGDSVEEFWALKNVSFEVLQGQVLGIIGRNGAGKSTLLKTLSRITEPTEGRIQIEGRVASLLEVGTGFHPELTGRENIFLNGAILGMTRVEIKTKFDEIVSFAEVERFLDTPVKRYSSGMYVRLAFAVAAHLDPEVLIIDEVLAVGDTAFQKKCLGKIKSMTSIGKRTVLFVSHSMPAVLGLCDQVLWLDSGKVVKYGNPQETIDAYLNPASDDSGGELNLRSEKGDFEVLSVQTTDSSGKACAVIEPGGALGIEVRYKALSPVHHPQFWFRIFSKEGPLSEASSLIDGSAPEVMEGEGVFRLEFPYLPLAPDQVYTLRMGARRSNGSSLLLPTTDVGHFRVEADCKDLGFHGEDAQAQMGTMGSVLLPYTWKFPGSQEAAIDPLGICKHQ